ncbi:MAG: hypothetical protein U0795_02965 [Pirellulales bacterium]
MLHRIRLAGPWEIGRRELSDDDAGARPSVSVAVDPDARGAPAVSGGVEAARLRLPIEWKSLIAAVREEFPVGGPARMTRIFHRPTGLEAGDRLWVGAAGWPATVHVSLNGHPLGRLDPWCDDQRWPITDRLELTNRLSVEFSTGDGRLDDFQVEVGQFWLDIESS